jgi:hypothetical protein
MLSKRIKLPELYYLTHRHDSEKDVVNYDDKILKKNLSSYLFNNNVMNGFLERLQPLLSTMFDRMNIIKNFKNYMVDKYER